MSSSIIQAIESEVKDLFQAEPTGHDWFHIHRVRNMSLHLSDTEGGDREVIELAALLHDVSDPKLNGGIFDQGPIEADKIMTKHGIPVATRRRVCTVIEEVSYKGSDVETPCSSIESQIVQDADRLDAMGAIGIARAFAYGGNRDREIYNPTIPPKNHKSFEEYHHDKSHTINHFYEKLLLLKDRLNTPTAKQIGQERHEFLALFLSNFMADWGLNDR